MINWDVINENIHYQWYEDNTDDTQISMDLFRLVRSLDPEAELFLNDYNILMGGLYDYVSNQI